MTVFTAPVSHQFGDQSLKFHAPQLFIVLQAVTWQERYAGGHCRPAFLHCLTVRFLYVAFIVTDKIILLSLKTWQLYAILILAATCTVNALMTWSENLNKFI